MSPLPLLREAYALSQRLDPPRARGSARNSYAILLERVGRLDEAATLLRGAVDEEVAAYRGDEAHYVWTRTLLGRVLRERGDLAGAREQLDKALRGYDDDAYPDGPRTATCLYQLALVRRAQRERAESIRPLLERALPVQEAKLGKDHAETAATGRLLAEIGG